jgi:hypothetical protein
MERLYNAIRSAYNASPKSGDADWTEEAAQEAFLGLEKEEEEEKDQEERKEEEKGEAEEE